MIYVIGVGHTIQHDSLHFFGETHEYIAKLRQLVHDNNIQLIAEEYSNEAARMDQVTDSVTKIVADELGVPHRYCDPDSAERRSIGCHSSDDDHLRLGNWFDKIYDKAREQVIFVCGDSHKTDFASLIAGNGFEVMIVENSFITKVDRT
ncbi:MAG: hypothetical protein WC851_00290 [Candidatus Shapirobacteria bacterium]|jgi:hypothetical protein